MDDYDEQQGDPPLATLETGQTVNDWKVLNKIGAGNYGNVYHVSNTKFHGAMKVESLQVDTCNQVLKIEAEVMRAMNRKKDVIKLLAAGKRETFSYIVMTLVGSDLTRMLHECGGKFTDGTVLRIAIRGMYALKQMHDCGYVHRDIKPCNFATAATGSKIIYLIDFGMIRRYAFIDKKTKPSECPWKFTFPRKNARFRGTVCYCSPNMHDRKEQGRHDDIISLLYVCIDLCARLPWNNVEHEERIRYLKKDTPEEKVCDPQNKNLVTKAFIPILKHLRTLEYFDRPDYLMYYKELYSELEKRNVKLTDPYDWEILRAKKRKEAKEDGTKKRKKGEKKKEEKGEKKENKDGGENVPTEPTERENKTDEGETPKKASTDPPPPKSNPEGGEISAPDRTHSAEKTEKDREKEAKNEEEKAAAEDGKPEIYNEKAEDATNFVKGKDHASVLSAEFGLVDVPTGLKSMVVKTTRTQRGRHGKNGQFDPEQSNAGP